MKEVIISETDTIGKAGLVSPAKFRCLADIEELARCAVGTARVPKDLSLIADNRGNKLCELFDGQFLA